MLAQCGCRADMALDWVSWFHDLPARFSPDDNSTIEIEIAPGCWYQSGWVWKEGMLYKGEANGTV